MSTETNLTDRLENREIILLDGGIGTELERLGVPMDHEVWCALALETHPNLVKKVHRSYIEAGADIIPVNSFASTRKALENAKLEQNFDHWNRLAQLQTNLRDQERANLSRMPALVIAARAPDL